MPEWFAKCPAAAQAGSFDSETGSEADEDAGTKRI